MFDEIANTDLSESDLPPTDSDWMRIAEFALTFDGYSHWGSFNRCAEGCMTNSLLRVALSRLVGQRGM